MSHPCLILSVLGQLLTCPAAASQICARRSKSNENRRWKLFLRCPRSCCSPPAVELLKRITAYTKELESLAQGDQTHRELHQKCNPAFMKFRTDIRNTAPRLIPKTRQEVLPLGGSAEPGEGDSEDSDGDAQPSTEV